MAQSTDQLEEGLNPVLLGLEKEYGDLSNAPEETLSMAAPAYFRVEKQAQALLDLCEAIQAAVKQETEVAQKIASAARKAREALPSGDDSAEQSKE